MIKKLLELIKKETPEKVNGVLKFKPNHLRFEISIDENHKATIVLTPESFLALKKIGNKKT